MTQANRIFFDSTPDSESTAKITVAQYSAEEVVQRFLGLYNCMSFREQLADLGIGKFQFVRRAKALRELKALCISLWGLALQKSFPQDAREFFTEFCRIAPELANGSKSAALLQGRVNIYIDLLNPKKDTDFMPVAAYLSEVLALPPDDAARSRLKLSLSVRTLYKLIFDKLV